MMGHHQDPHCSSSDGGANEMPCSSDEASLLFPAPPATGSAAVVRTLQPFDISTDSQGEKKAFLFFFFVPLTLK